MKNRRILTFKISFLIALFLSISYLTDAQDTTNINNYNPKGDSNFRYGNPADVPGTKQIIYGWGNCAGRGKLVSLKNLRPRTKKERDSLQNRRKEIMQIHRNNKKPDSSEIKAYESIEDKVSEKIIKEEPKSNSSKNESEIISNFEGGSTIDIMPPDCNGDVGNNYYVQATNDNYSIYNKNTGTLAYGPYEYSDIFQFQDIDITPIMDPVVLYDQFAERWFIGMIGAYFSSPWDLEDYYIITAVSSGSDPTSWYPYYWSTSGEEVPDFPKFGVWSDGYYMAINVTGVDFGYIEDIYVFERSKMLLGEDASWRFGRLIWKTKNVMHIAPPLDNDGELYANSPATFIKIDSDDWGGNDELVLYEFEFEWWSTESRLYEKQRLMVDQFISYHNINYEAIIDQPGTSKKLEAHRNFIMNRPQYRNFDLYESIVCCHTIEIDEEKTGIRWYELRRDKDAYDWEIRQQGSYSPDYHSRFMGSIALNSNGQIGLGYSVSSSIKYPSIAFCGQSTSEYVKASGIMDIDEEYIHFGTTSQDWNIRWGDYANLSVDPINQDLFWFTTEYVQDQGNKINGTKIAAFQFEHDCDNSCENGVCEPICGETPDNCVDCGDGGSGGGGGGGGGSTTEDPYFVNFSCDDEIKDNITSIYDFKINCSADEPVILCPYNLPKYALRLTPNVDGFRFNLGITEEEMMTDTWCDVNSYYSEYCHEEGWPFADCMCEHWNYFVEIMELDENLNPVTEIYSGWLKVLRTTELPPPSLWVYCPFYTNNGLEEPGLNFSEYPLEQGKYYKIKLASNVNDEWLEDTKVFYTEIEDLELNSMVLDGEYIARDNIIGIDLTVVNNTSVTLLAGKSINILDNTIINEGSVFYAGINTDLHCYTASNPYNKSNNLSYFAATDALNESQIIARVNENASLRNKLIIYPNPTSKHVNIKQIESSQIFISFIMLDVFGKEIFKSDHIDNTGVSIDLSTYPKGVYILIFKSGDIIHKEKLIYQ